VSRWEDYKKNLGETRPWDLITTAERVSDAVYEERWGMCQACPELIKLTKQCKKCGCFMKIKTTLPGAECPIGKWGKVDV
jgi:hypothetical protein